MKTSTFVIVIIIILIILGGAWWYYSMQPATAPDTMSQGAAAGTQETGTPATSDTAGVSIDASTSVSTAPMSATVHLTASGFSPSSVTIAKGGSVTYINDTTNKMWVASGQHPTHTNYDGTTEQQHCAAGYTGPKPFDQCANGNSYTFVFDKTGSFTFHNHSNASQFGSVVVQ